MSLRPVLTIAVVLLLTGCGDGPSAENSKDRVPSTITGVVTDVDASGLTQVESFTVRTEADQTYEIFIADDADLGFPPAHLNEHRISGEPVEVQVDQRGDKLFATSVLDA
ncbi:MAG: hypothetical protein M3280_11925 [Actinomycetota bacterium]|nr:hypothetical protein [Actinomycetota bacterium]